MSNPSENAVEGQAVFQLVGIGYRSLPAADAAASATGLTPVLTDVLTRAVARLNPELPEETVQTAARTVLRPPNPTLVQNNRWLHGLLMNGVEVTARPCEWRRDLHDRSQIRGGARSYQRSHQYRGDGG